MKGRSYMVNRLSREQTGKDYIPVGPWAQPPPESPQFQFLCSADSIFESTPLLLWSKDQSLTSASSGEPLMVGPERGFMLGVAEWVNFSPHEKQSRSGRNTVVKVDRLLFDCSL